MAEITITVTASSSSGIVSTGHAANTASEIEITGSVASPHKDDDDAAIINAVFAHIRALRALGTTTVNSVDIAEALRLPKSKVEGALRALRDRGVKPLK